MKQGISIKKASREDGPMLSSIINQSFRDVAVRFSLTLENCPKHPSNCTADWIEADFNRGVHYFILRKEDKAVGCVGLESPRPDLCYLERLSVLPENRRNGFGRVLALHAVECARAKGAEKISIGIIAEQTELKRWYEKLGFVATGTRVFAHLPFNVRFMEYTIDPAANRK